MSKKDNEIINFYKKMPKKYLLNADNPNYDLHLLKIPFKGLIISYSGGGKTNYLANLLNLFSKGKGTFNTIKIITMNKDEPIYNYLTDISKGQIEIYEGIDKTPNIDEYDKNFNHLIVFDDLVLSNDLKIVCDMFIRCRKLNISVIFISQSYYKIPKIMRCNTNYLILLKLAGKKDINLILSECSLIKSKEELLQMYNYATKEQFSPLIIDLNLNEFRKGFIEKL